MHHHLKCVFHYSSFTTLQKLHKETSNLRIVALNEGHLNACLSGYCIHLVYVQYTFFMCVLLGEAGGKGGVPYQSITDGKVLMIVSGLPDDLTFKKPSRYGRHQLERILEASEMLTFQISK